MVHARFPSNPLEIRLRFFLLFGFNQEPKKRKGKRVLLGNLVMGLRFRDAWGARVKL